MFLRDASNLPTHRGRSGLVEVPLDLPGWCLRFLLSLSPCWRNWRSFGGRRCFVFDHAYCALCCLFYFKSALPIVDDRCQGCWLCYCKCPPSIFRLIDRSFIDSQNYDFPNNCEDYVHRIGRTVVSSSDSFPVYWLSADILRSEPARRVSLTLTSPRTMPSRHESLLTFCVKANPLFHPSLRRW